MSSLPWYSKYLESFELTATATSPSMVSNRVVATTMNLDGSSLSLYANSNKTPKSYHPSCPGTYILVIFSNSMYSSSTSLIAVESLQLQFTNRLSRYINPLS